MLVIGIDPGLATTGFGLVRKNGEEFESINYGYIATQSHLELPERLYMIFRDLTALLEQYAPDALAAEQLFFSKNTRTALQVGEARGAILTAAARMNIPVYEYTPLQVKQTIAGYGRADKKQVQHMVRITLKLDETPKPDDTADALAIAICHLQTARWHQLTGGKGRS